MFLSVVVHGANILDRDGAKLILAKIKDMFPRLTLIWADGGQAGQLVAWVQEHLQCVLDIVKRNEQSKGFEVLPRRWFVERTLAWISHARRLHKEYERLPTTSGTLVYIAVTHIMLKSLRLFKAGSG